uniref:CaM kinase-like vesicle-associated protein n=1 Tax=Oncorhynchus kisutch TaxID=8019 RepID=A0A8C7F014_ONCKI
MPFGCLTLGEKKDYNNPSEVTDKYDLGQIVKSEEFCEIFRAKDKNTLKMFTCKKFLKKDGRKVRKAAKNEILILKMVKHHNILQLVDVFETRKEYFLFLELATGREVFDWILDQGYYSERDTSNVVRQVLEAVAYLHSQRIVHRNLKLENLVYFNRLKHSKIVISDFHLAKLENGLIKDPCGTPEYLAPEVVGRQRYGRPVDCWAIGVIVYILLSGNPPFYDEMEDDDYDNHDKNLFLKILSGDYEFDSPYWDDISDSAKSLVASLMEVEQDQRLTAQEAINHEWISGNAASNKNIRDGVCGQIEKNFAKAKWKVFFLSVKQTFFWYFLQSLCNLAALGFELQNRGTQGPPAQFQGALHALSPPATLQYPQLTLLRAPLSAQRPRSPSRSLTHRIYPPSSLLMSQRQIPCNGVTGTPQCPSKHPHKHRTIRMARQSSTSTTPPHTPCQ